MLIKKVSEELRTVSRLVLIDPEPTEVCHA